jgi:hypothetical protein
MSALKNEVWSKEGSIINIESIRFAGGKIKFVVNPIAQGGLRPEMVEVFADRNREVKRPAWAWQAQSPARFAAHIIVA